MKSVDYDKKKKKFKKWHRVYPVYIYIYTVYTILYLHCKQCVSVDIINRTYTQGRLLFFFACFITII